MTQNQAFGLIQYAIASYGTVKGCELVADALGIAWQTVYAWHRRGTVPQWRIEALARIKPDILGSAQAAE